jgi:hypothetical protein
MVWRASSKYTGKVREGKGERRRIGEWYALGINHIQPHNGAPVRSLEANVDFGAVEAGGGT